MGKSSGGGYDTSKMEKATEKSLALQKQIYDQTRADSQPWYQAGVGGVNRLADLLGVSGGSVQTRDQIRNELAPQYTTQASTGNMYLSPDGRLVDINSPDAASAFSQQAGGYNERRPWEGAGAPSWVLEKQMQADPAAFFTSRGYKPYQNTQSTVDTEALNKAVEDRLGAQSLPSDYGSLLDRFDMSKFEEDPGYQFQLEQGQKALERKMSASGDTFSPRAAQALAQYNQGMAAGSYNDAYNRYNMDQNNIYNRLAGISGMGQQATGTMAGAGQNYAQGGTQLYTSLANAQTAAAQAEASQPSMFSSILGLGATALGGYLSGGTSLLGGAGGEIASKAIPGAMYLTR